MIKGCYLEEHQSLEPAGDPGLDRGPFLALQDPGRGDRHRAGGDRTSTPGPEVPGLQALDGLLSGAGGSLDDGYPVDRVPSLGRSRQHNDAAGGPPPPRPPPRPRVGLLAPPRAESPGSRSRGAPPVLMPTHVLGVSCFYHDAAAALLRDGEIVAAAQEERFSRKKHDQGFPVRAIRYVLREAGIDPERLDAVGFYDKPLLKFERMLSTYVATFPRSFGSFRKAMPVWLHEKLWVPAIIRKELKPYRGPIYFAEHHMSHAASCFLPSPFEEAAILTIDGVGEWATASYGIGKGTDVKLFKEIRFPHSLGLLYSAFTYYLGFKVNSAEYKVMGLAPYGK